MKSSLKIVFWSSIIILLIFVMLDSANKHYEKRFATEVFAGEPDSTRYYSPIGPASDHELACQRAWNNLRWLVDSSTAFAIMRQGNITWEEIGILKQQAVYNHQIFADEFFQNMMVVFAAGGPIPPWSEQPDFPRNMEGVRMIMKSSWTPVIALEFVQLEPKEELSQWP